MVGKKPVPVQFVMHPQHDQNGTSHADGKAGQIGNRKTFVSPDVSPSYFQISTKHKFDFYSVLKLFTGLASAAFIARWPTVIQAIMIDPAIAIKKTVTPRSILYV
jgi:hypothetical protein